MKNFYLILFLILAVGNVCIYKTIFAPEVLEISVMNVGKGSATLIRTPNKKIILIDAGPDASILRALGTVLPPWQRTIDAVILTGAKVSMVGGLPDIKSRYRIQTPIEFGTNSIPYGARLTLDAVSIKIISPATFSISYGSTSLNISSSTPAGTYISDGKTVTKIAQ
ncbi:MAG: hypothetical protein NTU85_01220 [Candidatus Kaiserbacteria bacterium]|nr:hypothetical protein [Candidatus Kaiserbacteria bacterium]